MSPLVSIVIPCYNSQDFIKQAIDSAINQTYQNIEIIVIDDGSTDNSLNEMKIFGDRIRIESNPNQGVQLTRNRGIELATGEYVKFLDSDDVLLLDCIEKQVLQASQLPAESKAIVYGDAIWTDRQLQPIVGYLSKPQNPAQDPVSAILSCSPVTSCPLHKREYLLEIGGFDPLLVNRHENDLHLRLVLAGVQFIYCSSPIYKYRQYHDNKRLSQAAYTEMGAMYYFEVLSREQKLIEEKTSHSLRPAARAILAKDYWTYGRVVLREGYRDEAQKYFDRARNLDAENCVVGNFPYPLLVKLFTADRAESLMTILRKFNQLKIK